MPGGKRKQSPVAKSPKTKRPKVALKTASSPVPVPHSISLLNTGGNGVFPRPKVHILSWNVNGFKAWVKKPAVDSVYSRPDLDLFILNETKLQEAAVPAARQHFESLYPYQYWTCSTTKKGYSGVAVMSKTEPVAVGYGLGEEVQVDEGRAVTVEFRDFFVLATYVPNAGQKLERLTYRTQDWDSDLRKYLQALESLGKPVIWLGDLNVVHQDIDIFSMKGKAKCAGCTEAERTSFTETLALGFADTFREKYPDKVQFSWFSGMRASSKAENEGWRLDYVVVSRSLLGKVEDSLIYSEVDGSDHVPIEVVLGL